MNDPFKILGLKPGASKDEIKTAYRKLAKKWHPDRNTSPGAEAKFKQISEAHDAALNWSPNQTRQQGFGWNVGGFDFGSFFSSFTSGFTGHQTQHRSRHPNQAINLEIPLTFLEGVHGCKKYLKFTRRVFCQECQGACASLGLRCNICSGAGKTIRMRGGMRVVMTCETCQGQGREVIQCRACQGRGSNSEDAQFNLNVPPGIMPDSIMRMPGQGHRLNPNQPAGDVHIRLNPKMKNIMFSRDGLNISSTISLLFTKAALGGRVSINTIYGKEEISIPVGAGSTGKVILEGRGVHADGRQGSHHINLNIKFPAYLDEQQIELLTKIDKTLEE